MNYNKNYCLYFFEGLGSLLVILIHCKFPSYLGIIMDAIARYAVPMFFMISGFYLYPYTKKDNSIFKAKLKYKIFNVLLLCTFSLLFYFVLCLLKSYFGNTKLTFSEWLSNYFGIKKLLIFILFNEPSFFIPGWFLFALLYCYLIMFIFSNFFQRESTQKYLFLLSPLVLVLVYFVRIIFIINHLEFYGIDLTKSYLFRNWMLESFPLIFSGMYFKKQEKFIIASAKFSNIKITILLITGTFLSICECLLLNLFFGRFISYYIGTLLSVCCIFIFSIKNPIAFEKKFITLIGYKYSTIIYIVHTSIISITSYVSLVLNFENSVVWAWIQPLFVIIISILTAFLFRLFKKNIKSN